MVDVHGAVLAHQGGWDEILFVLTPLAVFAWLLLLARKRAGQIDGPATHDPAGAPTAHTAPTAGTAPAGTAPAGTAPTVGTAHAGTPTAGTAPAAGNAPTAGTAPTPAEPGDADGGSGSGSSA